MDRARMAEARVAQYQPCSWRSTPSGKSDFLYSFKAFTEPRLCAAIVDWSVTSLLPLLEMRLAWRGDGVLDAHAHGGVHGQVRQRGEGAPGCLLRFYPVRARLLWSLRCGGDGVEAQSQLLVNGAVGVKEDVGGVAVDTGEPNERYVHARLFGDLADHCLGGGFAHFEASTGQLPVAVIDPTDQQDLAGGVADRCERRRQHVVRARRVRILVVLT